MKSSRILFVLLILAGCAHMTINQIEGTYSSENEGISLVFFEDNFKLSQGKIVSDSEKIVTAYTGKYSVSENTIEFHSAEKSELKIVSNSPIDYAPIKTKSTEVFHGEIVEDKIRLSAFGMTLEVSKTVN